jgi:hypothetical protein
MERDGPRFFRQCYAIWLRQSPEEATDWIVATLGRMNDEMRQLKDDVARLKGRVTCLRKRLKRRGKRGKA